MSDGVASDVTLLELGPGFVLNHHVHQCDITWGEYK